MHSWAYAVRACVAVLLGQLIGSLFMQAVGPFVGVPVDLAIGAAAALLGYVARPSTRGPAPAAT